MVAGNHTSLVWCRDTICIVFYGSRKPYYPGMVHRYYMYYILWLWETIVAWHGVEILYHIYTIVAGNHTNLVWYGDTICIIFYGGKKPYWPGMVWRYYMYYILWLQETILAWYGMQILYALYFMVAGNHTRLVWCVDTICIIFFGCRKP
jgi:hypothetical protein